jgi:plasmid replication initiation protein
MDTAMQELAIRDRTQQPIMLNNAVHEFEALEKRVFYVVVNQIKKGMAVDKEIFNESLWFDVPTKLVGTKNYDRLKDVIDRLTSRKIKLLNKKGEQVHVFVPFPEIKYQKRWGFIKVRILDTAYPYLAELKEGYFWYQLKSALLLSRTYSQRFYEWFCQYQDMGSWLNVSIDFIRSRLDIPQDNYLKNNDFVRRVVHDSLREINEKTDINVSILNYHKRGRKITGFDFSIKTKKASDEAKKYQKIEEYYEVIGTMDQKQLAHFVRRIKEEYKISDAWYGKIFEHKELLEEVVKVDSLIQAGKVEINTTPERYMNGSIKRKLKELNLAV